MLESAHSGSIGVDPEMPRRGVRRIMPQPPTTRMGGFQHLYASPQQAICSKRNDNLSFYSWGEEAIYILCC